MLPKEQQGSLPYFLTYFLAFPFRNHTTLGGFLGSIHLYDASILEKTYFMVNTIKCHIPLYKEVYKCIKWLSM